MAKKRYVVDLALEEWNILTSLLKQERLATKKRMRAQVLFKVDEGEDWPAERRHADRWGSGAS